MTTGKALDGKPLVGIPHVRFDEGGVAATPSRGSLLYKLNKTMLVMKTLLILVGIGLSAALPASDAIWKSAADGDWMTVANWVDGVLPSSAARACFTNDTAAYTVTLNATDPQTAQGLVISGQVTIATHATRLNVNSPLILDGGGRSPIGWGILEVGTGGVLDVRNGGLQTAAFGTLSIAGGEFYGTNGFTGINVYSPDKIASNRRVAFNMTGGKVKLKAMTATPAPLNLNADQRYKSFNMSGGRMEIEGIAGNNSSYGLIGYGYGNDDIFFTMGGDAELLLKDAGLSLGWGTTTIGGSAKLSVTGNDSHVFSLGPVPSDGGKTCIYRFKDNSSVRANYVKYIQFGKSNAATRNTVGKLEISGGDHYFHRSSTLGEGTGTYTIDISGGHTKFGGYGVRIGTYPFVPSVTAAQAFTNATTVTVTGGALVFAPTESTGTTPSKYVWGTILGYGMTARTDFEFKAAMNVEGGTVTNSCGPFYVGAGIAEGHLLQTGGEVYKTYPDGTRDYNYCQHSLVLGFARGNGSWTVAGGETTCLPVLYVGGVTDPTTHLKLSLENQTFPPDYAGKATGTLTVTNTGRFATGWNAYVGLDGKGVIEVGDQGSFSCGRDLVLTNSVAGGMATLRFRLSGSTPPTFTVTRHLRVSEGSKLVVDARDFTFPAGQQYVKLVSCATRYGSFAPEDVTLLGRGVEVVQSRTGDPNSIWLRKIRGFTISFR